MSKLIFITGGVRSGKSAFAETYAQQIFQQYQRNKLIYIASGVAFDDEMTARIQRHQQDRKQSFIAWKTIEIQDEIVFNETTFLEQPIILWDCITTWLNNVLYKTEQMDKKIRIDEIEKYLIAFKNQLYSWKKENCIVLLVSNELLDEQISSFFEVNLYRSILGELHQWIVEQCDEAFEMDYSMSKRWK